MSKAEVKYVNDRTVVAADDDLMFAKNLQMLRKSRKPYLSQKRLAERLGVCRRTYANYEKGERQAPAFFVARAARFFRIPAEKLLCEQLWKE